MSETYVNDDRAFDPNKYVGVPRDTDPNHSEKYLQKLYEMKKRFDESKKTEN